MAYIQFKLESSMTLLKKMIDSIDGKVPAAAKACGVSTRAVYKWTVSGRLPRTDYTGETEHAERLADAAGGAFSAEWLKAATMRDVKKRAKEAGKQKLAAQTYDRFAV